MLIFTVYFTIRMHALTLSNHHDHIQLSQTALDILSCAAPILIPRLAFNLMSENMLFVSLRAMMSDFLTLTLLAVWCFAGFLLSMKWLHNDAHSVSQVAISMMEKADDSDLAYHNFEMDGLDLVWTRRNRHPRIS